MSSPEIRDLDWLALQYALGELAPAEAGRFEALLEEDLAACEALATAVRLVAGIKQTAMTPIIVRPDGNAPVPSVSPSPSRRSMWMTVAAGLSMAAAAIAIALMPSPTPRSALMAKADPRAAELVSLWTTGEIETDDDSLESDLDSAESGSEITVPRWMLAAVSMERGLSPELDSDDTQEN